MSETRNLSTASHASVVELKQNMDNFVICPFDSAHRVLPIRMINHLTRCARNHSQSKMVRCPFNITHVIKVADMQLHLYKCNSRSGYDSFVNPDALPPVEPRAAPKDLFTSEENWDNEPEVETYNPQAYCEKNRIIRNLIGAQPAERRNFRDVQRKNMEN